MSRWTLTVTDDGKYPTAVEKGEFYIYFSMHSDICMLHQSRRHGFIQGVDLPESAGMLAGLIMRHGTFKDTYRIDQHLETYDIPNSSQCLYKFVSKCPFQDTKL